MSPPSAPACALCGRRTYDPEKKERPWARAVSRGSQVLICPVCQAERPDWRAGLDHCERCGSLRLSAMLGETVCRECGHVAGALEYAWLDPAGPGT